MSQPESKSAQIHGLVYPPNLLHSLLLLVHRPHPHTPIRALSAHHFAALHLAHLTAHAPDNILFPFLHGLEGDNPAQNLFFKAGGPNGQQENVAVPRYRGLVWVVCEDDLPEGTLAGIFPPRRGSYETEEFYDDELDDDDDFLSEESIEDLAMDIDGRDVSSSASIINMDNVEHPVKVNLATETAQNMHPVAHRPQPPPPISISFPSQTQDHARRSSSASSSTCTTAASSSPFSTSTSATSIPTSSASLPSARYTKPEATGVDLPILTSTFRPSDLLKTDPNTGQLLPEFLPPKVPHGISLRNFGIQVPIYATLSDIVIYSPLGLTPAALALAEKFKGAVERKVCERARHAGFGDRAKQGHASEEEESGLVKYNVFVLDANGEDLKQVVPNLIIRMKENADKLFSPNTVDFEQREKDEMRELTKASEILTVSSPSSPQPSLSGDMPNIDSPKEGEVWTTANHWDPLVGQVFLGNLHDVPLAPPRARGKKRGQAEKAEEEGSEDPFDYRNNDPVRGFGYDLCIECKAAHRSFPSAAHLRAAEEHIDALERMWAARMEREDDGEQGYEGKMSVRPPPNASSVLHLRFPSSPLTSSSTLGQLVPYLHFLERLLKPRDCRAQAQPSGSGKRWSLIASFPHLSSSTSSSSVSATAMTESIPGTRYRASSTSSTSPLCLTSFRPATRSRPLKILIYSMDGYTDSSVPALCLLMAVRGLSLPEAYLELQVVKRRSFFVYSHDLDLLRRVETKLKEERAKIGGSLGRVVKSVRAGSNGWSLKGLGDAAVLARPHSGSGRPAALSLSMSIPPSMPMTATHPPNHFVRSRPRASTSPWLPSLFADHQTWFNDPRFDGSFPSRVLPFLYLGNLNHASNAFMLHALGITHVVSVGECALVPPSHLLSAIDSSSCLASPSANGHFVAGKGPGGQGSLWIEEREGRIKVLDIKGVCDDGIDTLEPQLEPICQWIEKARAEGGQVLVHCRVGVSRSATVAIAYVMKHLGIPLVDAYLIVRSRRLSVLIQPNMRLLYNLCGWEIKLAKERAGEDEEKLKAELARTLSWPYLAKEVHALNEKYLRI